MDINDLEALDKKAHWANEYIAKHLGITDEWTKIILELVADGLVLLIIAFLLHFTFKKLIIKIVSRIVRKSSSHLDHHVKAQGVFKSLAKLLPFFVLYILVPIVFIKHPLVVNMTTDVLLVFIVVQFARVLLKIVSGVSRALTSSAKLKEKAFDSYSQILRFVIYLGAILMILSILLGKDFRHLITGIGAFAAVLILVFKDSILGFVASVQMSINQVVKVGDWVEMPQYNADGIVEKITLTTVKVSNWDHTFSTVPAYAFITDSVKNWRGMQESGCRRMKRHLLVHPRSVKFLSSAEIEYFKQNSLLKKYLLEKEIEIAQFNDSRSLKIEADPNYRRQTNLGLLRAYLQEYLKNRTDINTDMILMVRQLQSSDKGIPLELYAFTRTTDWMKYEHIQSDIFDHVYSVLPYFSIEVFHGISGNDFHEFNAPSS